MNYSPEEICQQGMKRGYNLYNKNSLSNQSTPLSINKTQSNSNQEDFLSSQYFPTLSPLSLTQNRHIRKSITPYPIWYTAQQCRNRKQDSLLITDYEHDQDKENVIGKNNILQKSQYKDYENKSPYNFKKSLKKNESNLKNNKNFELSNGSKNLIMQSIKKAIQCSDLKMAMNLRDALNRDSASDILGTLSKSSKKSQRQHQQQQQYHINIQQQSSSTRNIESYSQTMNNIQMVMSKRPQDAQDQRYEQDNSLNEDNEIIEYFLTEQDSETQYNISNDGYNVLNELKSELNLIMEDNNNKMQIRRFQQKVTDKKSSQIQQPSNSDFNEKKFKKTTDSINYCDLLQNKIRQLSKNIEILHQKVCNSSTQQIFIASFLNENKKNSTMQSLDSRPDTQNTTTNHKPLSSLQLEINNKDKNTKKLIYHDTKIIFSKNDSGFVDFSQQFSQILNETKSQIQVEQSRQSNNKNMDNSLKIIFDNSPVSIEMYQQFQHVLGNDIVKSQKGIQLLNRSQSERQNILQIQNLSQKDDNFILQNQSYHNDDQSIHSPISSNPMTTQKQALKLSFTKILSHNQSQLSQSEIYDSSPKMKQGHSFISSSSNETFFHNQINKKFNNKFNEWLLMS